MSDWWAADPIAAKPSLDPRHRDLVVRTVLGEAGQEPDDGQAAVAAVIRNRVDTGKWGNDPARVVTAPSQFEPWMTQGGRERMFRVAPDSAEYKRAASNVDRAFGDERFDPTGGATHFFSPSAQSALGRNAPAWAKGEPTVIGRHNFYAPEGRVRATEVSAQKKTDWWLNDPPVASSPQETSPPATAEMPDTGGRFSDMAGENFRTAREGQSPAVATKGLVDKLVAIWENPPKDKLSLVGMIKAAYEGATLPGDVAAGKVAVTGEDGRTSPEVIERSAKLASVTAPRPAPGGVAAAEFGPRIIEARAAKGAVPTTQALKAAAKEGFESPEVASLAVRPTAIREFGAGLQSKLNASGLDDLLAPKTFGILSKFEKIPDEAMITGANLQTLRRTFQNAAGSPDKTERLAASKVIDAIDEFIPNVAARDILSGDPKAAAEAWSLARGNYAAAMRSEDIAKAVLKAQRQAEAAGSGANIDNATRQQFKAILNNDKKLRGFAAEEVAQMEALVKGTATGNVARLIGKAAPTGIVSGGLAGGAGFAAGGPVGAVLVPLAGYIGKKLGDRSTAKQVAALDELVRSRAPLAKAMEDFGVKFSVIERDGQNARTMSALALSARNLANNLKDAGVNLSPSEIMRALQAPGIGRGDTGGDGDPLRITVTPNP